MMELPNPLSHAYLVSGGSADSRGALIARMAAAYLCEGKQPPCGQCRACRKVQAATHPDVSRTSPPPDKAEIVVDQIRALRSDAYIRPNEGKRKVFIIDPADAMNPTAQNALLKVLEEGPAYAAFLLSAEQSGRLLATVRSRCELLTLPPEEPKPDPALMEQAGALSELLLGGSELAVMEALTALELQKPKGEQLTVLLAEVENQVARRLVRDPRRGAQVLAALKACREDAVFRPNPGQTLGRLMTQLF